MKRTLALLAVLAFAVSASAKTDHSSEYKMGIYLTARVAADDTYTDNFTCGHSLGTTVCSGLGIRANGVMDYQIQTAEGVWHLNTYRQAVDSSYRHMFNHEPLHFKAEKENPLDLVKNGDKVLFRVEDHRKIGGTDHEVYIPFANDPDKEAKFIGSFTPAVAPPEKPKGPSDNVKAMCAAHKLSPELETQMCGEQPTAAAPQPTVEATTPSSAQSADPRMQQFKKMCDTGLITDSFGKKMCDTTFPK